MTEQNPNELLAALSTLLNQASATAPLTTTPTGQGLGMAGPGPTAIRGISVPVKIKVGNGSLRTYVELGPEAVTSQAAFMAALEQVERTVGPLDIWESSRDSGLGGNRYGSHGGFRR
ncbi:MAG: hypothetical protein P9F75_00660 [Candidatus Contendobacter sp.]|nr:hypothetical protein [Candidatus Contendobacter sp.]